jgi:hypothetical protein
MAVQVNPFSAQEIAERGKAIYEQEIRGQVEPGNHGKVVAIDVRSGAYELGDDAISTTSRLRLRYPHAEVWLVRVGHLAYRNIR